MSKIKIMCVHSENQSCLTVGNLYEVEEVFHTGYVVIDNYGMATSWPSSWFKHMEINKPQTNLEPKMGRKIRLFPTGAIRSDNTGRERYDFISPLALKELAQFLATTENSFAQINYFLGIPEEACLESMLRHINDYRINGHKQEAVAMLFNAVALVHTIALRERNEYKEIYKETKLITQEEYEKIQINQESSQKG